MLSVSGRADSGEATRCLGPSKNSRLPRQRVLLLLDGIGVPALFPGTGKQPFSAREGPSVGAATAGREESNYRARKDWRLEMAASR